MHYAPYHVTHYVTQFSTYHAAYYAACYADSHVTYASTIPCGIPCCTPCDIPCSILSDSIATMITERPLLTIFDSARTLHMSAHTKSFAWLQHACAKPAQRHPKRKDAHNNECNRYGLWLAMIVSAYAPFLDEATGTLDWMEESPY